MKRALLLLSALLFTALAAATLQAHELGKTRATARFTTDGTYTIDVQVDPEALLAKLQILAGQTPASSVPPSEIPARIEALRDLLLANVHVTFDGTPDRPTFVYLFGSQSAAGQARFTGRLPLGSKEAREDASPPPNTPPSPPDANQQGERGAGGVRGSVASGTIRLAGRVPAGARTFRFAYGLVLGAFPLTVEGRTVWLTGTQTSDAFAVDGGAPAVSRVRVAGQYLVLGFEHIVPKGLDHILFVLGIFLLGTAWRPVLLQVTTFTIAHSITLGLTIYGVVSLPSAIVEPLIALSITYVAVENLFTSTLRPWRVGLVFVFGLLHGMGFAGVLKELGLPRSEFLTALVTFNLGVEAGQLAVIATALIAVGWWRRSGNPARYRQLIVIPASLMIAAVGAYWTVARAFGLN